MKITIGDKYHKETPSYVEELQVIGTEKITDGSLKMGDVYLPVDGSENLKVRAINSISCEYFTTSVQLKVLIRDYDKGEVQIN